MRDYIKGKYASLVKTMEDKKDLSGDDEKALKAPSRTGRRTDLSRCRAPKRSG
jgi:hypothetical protein